MSKGTGGGDGRRRKSAKRPRAADTASRRATTDRARERAAGFVPSPNFAYIASDPLKAKIVAVALQRPYSPSEFAKDEEIATTAASYAFRRLKEKSILELVDEVKVRGTVKHMYRANEAAFVSDADWGELAAALRPLFVGTILEDFSRRVTQAIETGHLFERHDFTLYWAPQDLDEIAYQEQVEIAAWCIEESRRLVCDTVRRRADGETPEGGSFPVTFAIAAFLSPTHAEYEAHEKAQAEDGGGRGEQNGAKTKRTGKRKPEGKGKKS